MYLRKMSTGKADPDSSWTAINCEQNKTKNDNRVTKIFVYRIHRHRRRRHRRRRGQRYIQNTKIKGLTFRAEPVKTISTRTNNRKKKERDTFSRNAVCV